MRGPTEAQKPLMLTGVDDVALLRILHHGQKRAGAVIDTAPALFYPRDGLFLYGPVDGGRPEVHYGAIGTPAGVARLERWAQSVAGFLPAPPPRRGARTIEPQHIAFPGFAPAFNSAWPVKPRTTITTIDQEALSGALHVANHHEAIKAAVDLYEWDPSRLVRLALEFGCQLINNQRSPLGCD
jgi:hypothetical protein